MPPRLWPFSASTLFFEMVMSELLLLNCTWTGAASTTTVSSTPPTASVKFAVMSPRWGTRTLRWSAFLNPDNSAMTE